jgi:hypothetical protein
VRPCGTCAKWPEGRTPSQGIIDTHEFRVTQKVVGAILMCFNRTSIFSKLDNHTSPTLGQNASSFALPVSSAPSACGGSHPRVPSQVFVRPKLKQVKQWAHTHAAIVSLVEPLVTRLQPRQLQSSPSRRKSIRVWCQSPGWHIRYCCFHERVESGQALSCGTRSG